MVGRAPSSKMANKKFSIPVVGTLVVSELQLLKEQIKSVDFPIENYVIFNNNGKGEIDEELNKLAVEPHDFIKKIKVCHLPANVGIATGWNLIIKSYLMAPYWVIVNADVSFGKGFLQEVYEKAQDPEVGIIHGFGGDFGLGSWCVFLLKDWVVQRLGLFDENFYPAYAEDVDYIMRIIAYERRGTALKKIINLDSSFLHGGRDAKQNKEEYLKYGRQSSRGNPELEEKMKFSTFTNFDYLDRKWGSEWRECNPFDAPFNQKDVPLSYTTFDLKSARKKYLGF